MRMYRLEGTPREVGLEYGALLKSAQYIPLDVSDTRLRLARKCEKIVRQHAPELLEELEGLIEGGSYDPDRLKTLALMLKRGLACSVVAVSGEHTADGQPLFGRNFDWYTGAHYYTALCEVHMPGHCVTLGCNDFFIGRHDGINEAGLAIAITYVAGERDRPGILFPLAVRHALNVCRTTEEAVAFLESIPHVRNVNFLVADADSRIAVVEATPSKVRATYAKNGFAAITNQFQTPQMINLENVRIRPADSEQRQCRLQAWFDRRQGPVTPESLRAILSAKYPAGVRAVSRGSRRVFGTAWSWVASLGNRAIAFADEMHVRVNYRPIEF